MYRGGKNQPIRSAIVLSIIWGLTCILPAAADITTSGSIDPNYDSTDPWVLLSDLIIGLDADAGITVSDGSQVQDGSVSGGAYGAFIARSPGATASVTVTDPNSAWDMTTFVGEYGQGTMVVENGARMIAGGIWVGYEPNSVGDFTLTGAGTTLVGRPEPKIQIAGAEAPVVVEEADHQQYVYASIGSHGTGNFTISDGARVVSDSGNTYLGYFSDGVGNLTVTGPNSVWDQTGAIRIGHNGTGTLLISDGGSVTSTTATLAHSYVLGTSEGTVTVTDPNSIWRVSDGLYIGGDGHGELLVSNGGRVESEYAHINSPASATSASSATVTGSDSLWQNERYLVVGHDQRGQLAVQDGGQVTDANAYVGWKAGGDGVAYVGDPNSVWATSNELHVGCAGTGTLRVEEGGRVTSDTGILGTDATGEGWVSVSDAGSRWENAGSLEIGRTGYGSLAISSGGRVVTTDATLAVEPNSTGVVGVHGTGSTLEVQDTLTIGAQGDASMAVSLGGQVLSQDAVLAQEAGSTGLVNIHDANSLWSISDRLDIGGSGDANMVISNGARVASERSYLNGAVTVSDPGSTWTSGQVLSISDGGDLTIADGGQVTTTDFAGIDGSAGSGRVVVTGTGSLWSNQGELHVGQTGGGQLLVSDGGQVMVGGNAYVRAQTGTALATVTGAGSRWTNAGTLVVGDFDHLSWVDGQHFDAYGTVVASDGGLVEAGQIVVYEGSVLTGDGTFAANQITNHGIIRPGNSIGTLTFDGDLVMDTDSLLEVEIDNDGNSDKLIVTGEFSPGLGHVKPVATELIVGSHEYTVVEANSVSWPIAAVVDEYNTAFLQSSIGPASDAEPNVVAMHVTALPFDDPSVARTSTQTSFGSVVNQLAQDPNDPLPLMLQQLDTAEQARTAYDQLSGRTRAPLGAVTVAAGSRPMNIVSSRMRGVSSGQSPNSGATAPMAARSDAFEIGTSRYTFALGNGTPYLSDEQWGVWGKWYGLYGDRETDGAELGYQYSAYGAGFGMDYQVSERWLLGVTGGYWDGDVDFASSADRTSLTGTYFGLYGSYETPKWYVDSIVTYSRLDYETTRYVDLTSEQLAGDFGGNMFSGYVEAGFNWWRRADCLIQPLASLQVSYLDIDGFTESGGTSSLAYDGEQYTSYRGGLGLKAVKQLFRHMDERLAEIELRGRWVHEFGDTQSSVDAVFATEPAAGFRIEDAAIARDSALLGVGLNAKLGEATRLFLDYDTELNPDRNVQIFSAGFEYRW